MSKLLAKQSGPMVAPLKDSSQAATTEPNQPASRAGTLTLQATLGNGAVQRLLQRSASENLPVSEPGDRHEQEADQRAEQVMSLKPRASRDTGADSGSVSDTSNSGNGSTLTPDTRQFFEPRFGHNFSNVRVHTDGSANNAARSLGARAYTVGEDITFAPGEYQPSTQPGRHLLAHELAHVVQQTSGPLRASPKIQRKLKATGDTAGFAAMANSIITVQLKVQVSGGQVSLVNSGIEGPPTREQHEFVTALQRVINDPTETSVEFIHGRTSTRPADRTVLIGAYATGQIDLDDIGALGSGLGGTTTSTGLIHEIVEQYRKQVHGEAFGVAHRAGESAEEAVSGATRGAHSMRQIDPTTVEVTVPWTYPDGRVVDVVMTVRNGNVISTTRRVRP
jgi:uncharacterized protein DUF4157